MKQIIFTLLLISSNLGIYAENLTKLSIPIADIHDIYETDIIEKASIIKVYRDQLEFIDNHIYFLHDFYTITKPFFDRVETRKYNYPSTEYDGAKSCNITFNNKSLFQHTPSDTLYIMENTQLIPYIVFDFGIYKYEDDLCKMRYSLHNKYIKSRSKRAGYIYRMLQISDKIVVFNYHYNNQVITAFLNLETGRIINGIYQNDVFDTSYYFPGIYKPIDDNNKNIIAIPSYTINAKSKNAKLLFTDEDIKTIDMVNKPYLDAYIVIEFTYKDL